ncbi:unnamed protein product [Periconia digitata]|uniref:Probable double zinc ribbon domain-containing protein n=1 Tax=Periconia digitata TaxID=1303443 RepID=A0A9W4USA8_9PLEO|nr:unnamed protein product [Periconia digitata]
MRSLKKPIKRGVKVLRRELKEAYNTIHHSYTTKKLQFKEHYANLQYKLDLFKEQIDETWEKTKLQIMGPTQRAGHPLPELIDWKTYQKNPNARFDGWMICHRCRAHTSIVYLKGPYPFNRLRCMDPNCDTPITRRHTVTEILEPFDYNPTHIYRIPDIPQPLVQTEQIPFCIVCSRCGLAHRARKVPAPPDQRERRRMVAPGMKPTWISFQHVERCADYLCGNARFVVGAPVWLGFVIRFDHLYNLVHLGHGQYFGIL